MPHTQSSAKGGRPKRSDSPIVSEKSSSQERDIQDEEQIGSAKGTPVSQKAGIDTIDWPNWSPTHHATLTFIQSGSRVLLIRKKRGLGAGLINGPGGKLEAGESTAQCAVREVEEEVGLTPLELEPRGELRFQFLDGYAIHVHVFVAKGHRGELCETDEVRAIWFERDDIPYEEMWEDDRLWLPHVLSGGRVQGDFIFDDEKMMDHRLACT